MFNMKMCEIIDNLKPGQRYFVLESIFEDPGGNGV